LLALNDGDEGAVGWRRLRREDIRCLEDSEELQRKAEKAKRIEKRRAREDAQLRSAGILPLVVERDESEGEEGDEDEGDVFNAGAATARPMPGLLQHGESRRVLSWIWTNAGSTGTDIELEEGTQPRFLKQAACIDTGLVLRVEWCKAWARTRRWSEEIKLLEEEWRRVPLSFAFEERKWVRRAQSVPIGVVTVEDAEGLVAYATKQADVYRNLARRAVEVRAEPELRRGVRRVRQPLVHTWLPGFGSAEVGDAVDELDTEAGDPDGAIEDEDDREDGHESDDEDDD
jgi:hypothetical protein